MFNWKKKIDDQEEAEKRDRERREAEERARQVAEQKEADEKWDRSRKLQFHQLGQDFQCHVCHTPATEPGTTYENVRGMEDGCTTYESQASENWNSPGDLWQCSKCNKWTCAEHIHRSICQTCAEKL